MFKLALDAGHGLYTAGKRCLKSIDSAETREWVLNSRICNMLEEELKGYEGIEVMRMDDVTGATDVSTIERCRKANEWGADFYLSTHHNAGIGGGGDGGLIVFRYNKLSANGETGNWQKRFYEHLIAAGVPKGNRSTPLGTAGFDVLAKTKMKAVLVECGFMDSTTDTPLILTEEFARKVVKGYIAALVELAGINKKVESPPVEPTPVPEAVLPEPTPAPAEPEDTPTEAEPVPDDSAATVDEEPKVDESPSEINTPIVKKSWVEVVKEILGVILSWLKMFDNSK